MSPVDRSIPGRPVGGRRRPAPAPKGLLRLTDFVDVAAVAHSPSCDWTTGVDFGLYANDRYGDCGPVAVANHRRLVTKWLAGAEQRPTQDDVFDLYRRSGNPDFDPATGAGDNGVDMRVMLDAVHAGGIGGQKAVAYAAVDPHDPDQMKAAIEIFHGILQGVDLQDAQKTQGTTWEYVPGSPDWGGHAVLGAAFDPNDVIEVSWEELIAASLRFLENQDGEAYIVVWPEHLSDPRVDRAKLAAAYKALTDRDLPIPNPAPPVPPVPVPPGPPSFPPDLVAAVQALAADPASVTWLTKHHHGEPAETPGLVAAVLAAAAGVSS